MTFTALIAEDEPLLAQSLRAELARVWPELDVVAVVGDGLSAVQQALSLQPDVLFLDIRMPGLTGLEAAADIADQWPTGPDAPAHPRTVFVTAYDQYAVQAFELNAVDYLLKPVQADRLRQCKEKLARAPLLVEKHATEIAANSQTLEADRLAVLERHVAQLRGLMATLPSAASAASASAAVPGLLTLQVSVGQQIKLVPVHEVLYFEAADKYVRVVTAAHEHLIRLPLKELLPQLDEGAFWQVHRSTVVRVQAISHVSRDPSGRLHVHLRERPDTLVVSRLYAERFRAM